MDVAPPKSDDDLPDWINSNVRATSETEIMDMRYFAPYDDITGFKVSVDGFHNTTNAMTYGVIMSLNPPATLYKGSIEAANTEDV